jgi:hypothetical protein
MTRTYSTITWGLALIVAAIASQTLATVPWTLAAAGTVPVLAGALRLILNDNTDMMVKAAEQRAKRAAADV